MGPAGRISERVIGCKVHNPQLARRRSLKSGCLILQRLDASEPRLQREIANAVMRSNRNSQNLNTPLILGSQAFKLKIPLLFSAALKGVQSISLKTLDLLHLASAYVAVRLSGKTSTSSLPSTRGFSSIEGK